MIHAQAASQSGFLGEDVIRSTLEGGLSRRFTGQKVLVLVPDHTRTFPLPGLFRMLIESLSDLRQLDFMVALGTHPPLSEADMNRLFGITAAELSTTYRHISLLNHAWDDPSALTSLGAMEGDEIKSIAGSLWHPSLPDRVEVRINKVLMEYDQVLILGPVFPHEVAGMSGGAKYLFPGISGSEMIHATHWLGALTGVIGSIGVKDTPVRAMIHAAARKLNTPVTLAAMALEGHDLCGVFVGDLFEAWSAAADLSAQRNIHWCEKPFQRVLSCAPAMYDELWTAGKAMYKVEPVVAPGGEVIIYAPHLEIVSRTHGEFIHEVGYHVLPYFLNDWERFKHIPLGVLAHSTHVRGSGSMEGGLEKPNVRVTLASKIPPEDCARLNLGYLDPAKVDFKDFQDSESEGVLFVPRAGEILYRLSEQAGGI